MHRDDVVDVGDHLKPEMIIDYNQTKGGVDTLDQAVRRELTMQEEISSMTTYYYLFYILDLTAYNSFILFFTSSRTSTVQLLTSILWNWQRSWRVAEDIRSIDLPFSSDVPQHTTSRSGQKRCADCPRSCDWKTKIVSLMQQVSAAIILRWNISCAM